jgi:hypothetical protein
VSKTGGFRLLNLPKLRRKVDALSVELGTARRDEVLLGYPRVLFFTPCKSRLCSRGASRSGWQITIFTGFLHEFVRIAFYLSIKGSG